VLLEVNKLLWEPQIGDEYRTWLNSRVTIWAPQTPDWLTNAFFDKIPPDWIEDKAGYGELKKLINKEQ
jgi:hypothetical protein